MYEIQKIFPGDSQDKIHKKVTNFLRAPIDKTGGRVYTVEN